MTTALSCSQILAVLFPVLTVKCFNRDIDLIRHIDTSQVHAERLRMRAWNIKRFDAAMFTEQVACNAGMKSVFMQALFTANQSEPACRNNQVQVSRFMANWTITPVHGNFAGDDNRDFYPATMASTWTRMHIFHPRMCYFRRFINRQANQASDGP